MAFFFEVLIGGLLSGVMYSLVALGFVLIYKASGVFNFAQGAMVFFAALTCVSLTEYGLNFWLALLLTLAAMIVLGLATERVVLRPLVNQPQITLFMATIGLTFFIEGLAQLLWGSQPHNLDLGIQDEPIAWIAEIDRHEHFEVRHRGRRYRRGAGGTGSRCSSAARGSAARCALSPTTTRRRSRSASRCSRSGESSGRWPVSWRWSRDCCGAHATACSSR